MHKSVQYMVETSLLFYYLVKSLDATERERKAYDKIYPRISDKTIRIYSKAS